MANFPSGGVGQCIYLLGPIKHAIRTLGVLSNIVNRKLEAILFWRPRAVAYCAPASGTGLDAIMSVSRCS
jgi:hypothetical protein